MLTSTFAMPSTKAALTADITELQRVRFVMKGGKIIRND